MERASNILLRLYISGGMPGGQRALENLMAMREALDKRGFQIEIIDIAKRPVGVGVDAIVITPTLSDESVDPPRRMVGNCDDLEQIVEFFRNRGTEAIS